MKRRHALALAALPAAACLPLPSQAAASERAQRLARQLDRGINFGNMVDSPKEGDWGLRLEQRYIELVGEGGFTQAVRLPVRWSNHASLDAEARIDPVFFARIDATVDALLARGCTVLLDMHHYRQLDGDALDPGELAVDEPLVLPRFFAMWRQIAERYADRDERLLFEPYNEPHGRLEPLWNEVFAQVLQLIRHSNPERVVVVGPTLWNNATHLARLRLPPDPNLIVTIHCYEPFDFTHQGAAWVEPRKPLGVSCCSKKQQLEMEQHLELAQAFVKASGYPVLIGEFGAYSKAPAPARTRYLRFMREAMESRGLPWMYWELASGFGVYDPKAGRFRPEVFEPLYGGRTDKTRR